MTPMERVEALENQVEYGPTAKDLLWLLRVARAAVALSQTPHTLTREDPYPCERLCPGCQAAFYVIAAVGDKP